MKTMMRFLIVCYLIITQISIAQWVQTNGPYGGDVLSFAVSDTNLFAGTKGGGVFLSTNNGTSWTPANSGLTDYSVQALAVFPNGPYGGDVLSFAVSDTNLFAGTKGCGVFLSTNNGTMWTAASNGLPTFALDSTIYLSLHALAVSGAYLFAGTSGGGVYRSTDNGTNWTSVSFGMTNHYVHALAVFPNGTGGKNLFAGTDRGVFLSTNNGTTWTAASNGLPTFALDSTIYQSIHALSVSETYLFAGTSYGVYLSTNNGTSWTAVNEGLPKVPYNNSHYQSIHALLISGTNLFAGTDYGGVFLSTNYGSNWTAINSGLTNPYVHAFAVSPNGAGGSNFFAGTEGGGVFLSTNNGTNWTAVNTGLTSTSVWALAVSGTNLPAGQAGLFAGTDAGVFLSTNNGTSWVQIPLDSGIASSIAVSGTNIIAATPSGIYVSTNNGLSWTRASFTNGEAKLAVSGPNVFAGTDDGVSVSTDCGTSWAQTSLDSVYIEAVAVSGTVIIAASSEDAFLSTDNGASWRFIETCWGGGTSSIIRLNSMAFSRGTIFVSLSYQGPPGPGVHTDFLGVYSSTDLGNTWSVSLGDVWDDPLINCFAVSGTNLFAGGGGVYLSTNNDTRWNQIDSGLTKNGVRALAVSGSDLFAGTEGGGVWRRPLSEMITSVSVEGGSTVLPTEFALDQNFPNPFNPSTTIRYALPNSAKVRLMIYDLLGREIATLVNEEQSAGWKEVEWNANYISSGIYFYQVQAGDFVDIKKMLLIK